MQIHETKCWPEHYQPLIELRKKAELRIDDRNYQTGDVLYEREWEPLTSAYTGRESYFQVTHTVRGGPWLVPGYVMMSVEPLALSDAEWATLREFAGKEA